MGGPDHIYIYIYIYIYVHKCEFLSVSLRGLMSVCLLECLCVCVHARVFVSVGVNPIPSKKLFDRDNWLTDAGGGNRFYRRRARNGSPRPTLSLSFRLLTVEAASLLSRTSAQGLAGWRLEDRFW